jgi:hypothetical protein
LVVTPSITPRLASASMSLMLPVSTKIFIALSFSSAIPRPPG